MIVEMDAPEPEAVRRARAQVRGLGTACAVMLVVGLLGLSVVGKSPRPSKQALSVVLSAASRTSGASTARFALASQVTVQGHSVPGATADGVTRFVDPKMVSATLHLATLNFDVITDAKTEYIKLPANGALRARTPWVAIDISALADSGQLGSLGGPTLPGGGDPTATLDGLKAEGMVTSAAAGGKAQVRGTSTRVYHVVLDSDAFKQKVLDRAKASGLPATSAAALEFKDPLVDLYVDGQGLVRRMVTTIETKFSGGSTSATLTNSTQLDLFDFGIPVQVQTPPASQVTRVGSLAELSSLLTTGR